jgi:DNA-binding NarL/FixJ family response regulator
MMDTIGVLVVDDHPLFRQGLKDALRLESDIRVVGEGANADEALRLIRELLPDVALLDINLPDTNGLQVARQVRGERLRTAIVMLTAYDDAEQILHAFRAGAAAYCPKDIAPGKLVDVVRNVAHGHYVVNEQILDRQGLDDWMEKGISQVTRPYLDDTEEVFSPLSPREMEILQHVTRGLSNKQIAQALGISHQTVKNHMTAILHKLDVEDRTQAAMYAVSHGWVRPQNPKR